MVLPLPVGPVTRMIPVGRAMNSLNLGSVVRRETQLVDRLQQDVGVEDAQHRLLAERGGHGADAQLDLAAALIALDAAVLRPALLGQVRAGEQLDPRHDRLVDDLRDHVHVVQHAVDAQAHQRQVALGLEVDVRGALLEGVAEDVVERLHHRRRRRVEVGRRLREELLVPEVDRGDAALAELLLGVLQARLQVVEALVDLLDVAARGHHPVDLAAGDALHVLERERRERVVDGDRDAVAVLRDRHHPVAPCERARDRLGDDVQVEVERVDLDVRQAGVRRERLRDLRLARDAQLQHRLLGREAVHLLGAADLVRLLGAQDVLGDEHGEELRCVGRRRRCGLPRRRSSHGPLGGL